MDDIADRDLPDAHDRHAPESVEPSNGLHQDAAQPTAGLHPHAANGSNGSNGHHSESIGNVPIVEAVMLLEGHPATLARLARITGLSADEIERCLAALRERYATPECGFQITRVADSYSIMPRAELWERLRHHYGNGPGKRLSRAALETLTIIAYSQPVTRSQIEAMRGVSADSMIRLLTDRQLIRPVGYKEGAIGRPTLFGTTNRFLETFGLETIDDLPKLDKVEESRFQRG